MDEKNINKETYILSDKEIRRYASHIELPGLTIEGQEKIKKAKILVIGAGGKGSSVLQNLASAGIGTIGICDNSPIAEDQLCRQYLFGDADMGKQKAIVARQKLLQINQLNEYRLHNVYLTEETVERICSGYDILVDSTDNFPAHYLIHDVSIRMHKPVIFGRIVGPTGFVSVFNYRGGPSLRCCYPEPPTDVKNNFGEGFVNRAVLVSIIGSILANETIKVSIQMDTELSGNLLSVDAANYKLKLSKITRDPSNFR